MDAEKITHHEDRHIKTPMPNMVDTLMVILISQISGPWLVVFGCLVVGFEVGHVHHRLSALRIKLAPQPQHVR